MEYNGLDFLEELLSLRGENDFYTTKSHIVDNFLENPYAKIPHNPCYEDFSSYPFDHQTLNCSTFTEYCTPFGDEAIVSSNNKVGSNFHEEYSLMSIMDDHLEVQGANNACKTEQVQSAQVPYFESCTSLERKSKAKKMAGQPSKNLMAERRRRKRLNDRLSMLRSVVPKISKMDRTSILGDTIDYMKELLEKIKTLQEEIEVADTTDHHHLSLTSLLKDSKPNEGVVRNSPKFDVERGNTDTRIEICCTSKPGLLLSTVTTLEALGLEIQQCVITCFNDFGMQASCSEEMDHSGNLYPEDIKQALFRNAGYGGRCL